MFGGGVGVLSNVHTRGHGKIWNSTIEKLLAIAKKDDQMAIAQWPKDRLALTLLRFLSLIPGPEAGNSEVLRKRIIHEFSLLSWADFVSFFQFVVCNPLDDLETKVISKTIFRPAILWREINVVGPLWTGRPSLGKQQD